MFALSSVALLGLVLLTTPPVDIASRTPLPVCEVGTLHIELMADAPGKAGEVCIHPGLSTTLVFDSQLGRVELAGRERWFRVVLQGENALTLIPSEALAVGERVPVTVYFLDAAALASATLELVVHPTQAQRQVEVTRHPRTLLSYREGEQQARAEVQQCREEKARLQAECGDQVGLTVLIDKGLMGTGGIVSMDISRDVSARPGSTLRSAQAHSYRSDTECVEGALKVVRLAVRMELRNMGQTPWRPTGAVLTGPEHVELNAPGVWSREPIPPGDNRLVVVEVAATAREARGTFTLELRGEDGSARSEFFEGVTFP